MKRKIPVTILFATVMLVMMVAIPVKADVGARTEDLIVQFYSSVEHAYADLKAGDIDMVGYEITSDLYADAILDPNIILGPVGDRGKYEFDINNNYTCSPLFPGLRSPTNYLNFRRGLAFLVDKTQIVDTFCGGFAQRIDQPIAYLQNGWRNQSYWYEDGTYPYEFNPVQAAVAFDAAGFVAGPDPNPDPNTGAPGYTTNMRIHPDTGVTMNPLEVCIRTDDARRLEAGRALCDQLRILGIPVNQVEAVAAVLIPKVMDNFEYHVYTGGWSLGRFPAWSAYGLYHSSQYRLRGSNYISGNASDNTPMYPVLDTYLYGGRFPADYAEAQSMARKAFGEVVDKCVTIELFSAASFWAWSSELLGVVNADGTGPENSYTFMNAYKADGTPIKYGLKTPPNAMNKIYSQWFYDYQCLWRMDLYSGIDVPPYDQSVDQPGYILNWTVDTWVDPDDAITKSKISQTYRDDAWFVEPVTGNKLEHVNITHHYASIWYDYQLTNAWYHYSIADIKTVRMTSPHSLEFYWNLPDYWNTYMGRTSIKSFNWWSQGTLSSTVTETLTADVVTGYVTCTAPVFWVVSCESGGTPLTLGTDYDIYKDPDGPHNADVRIINPSYLGASISITYLATNDASGYTPGELPWQVALEGAGMFYAIDHIPLAGGFLTLRRNPHYPMETPPLGEIDFIKKPNGCDKVDIYDVVIAASAYGSQGEYVPDAHWFPGADLAPSGGKVDIFDVVTVKGKCTREPLNLPMPPPPVPDKPIIYVDPPEISAPLSSTFTVSVKISDVENLYGFDVQFRWDPTLLGYVSHSVRVPKDTYSDGVLWSSTIYAANYIDAEAGTYWIAYSSLHPAPPFSGDGTIFTMTFEVIAVGSSYLTFDSTDLADKAGKPIFHYGEGALVSEVSTPYFLTTVFPTSLTIQQGDSDTSTITITSINGFNQPVQLTVFGAPSGVTTTLNPEQATPPPDGSTTSTLTVSAITAATSGSYILIVTGTNGALTHSVEMNLEIVIPGEPPTCSIQLQKEGVEIDAIDIWEFFDIYVGGSTDDTGIRQVRFSSDDAQDGIPTGECTEWYSWSVSSGDWDASTKITRWAFATPGYKEVWMEVEDDDGWVSKCAANIYVPGGFTRLYVNPREILVSLGANFAVEIAIDVVADFNGVEFNLYWDTRLLDCTSTHIKPPWDPYIVVTNELSENYNATHGRYRLGMCALGGSSFTGSTALLNITFKCTGTGGTPLDLTDTFLADSAAHSIPHATSDGYVEQIAENQPPNKPTAVSQYRSDGVTVIPEGGTTPESTVVFKGTVSDPEGDSVRLEIELRQIGESFTGEPTPETISDFVLSGTRVTITRYGLVDADYKWQYRAKNSEGAVSDWTEFEAMGNVDFSVNVPALRIERIEPSSPIASRQYLRILGEGFVSESAVYFNDGEETYRVPEERTRFVDSNTMEVVAGLGNTLDQWKVWVVNPGSESDKLTFNTREASNDEIRTVLTLARLWWWENPDNALIMTAIAGGESRWNANSTGDLKEHHGEFWDIEIPHDYNPNINDLGACSWGLWQILMPAHQSLLEDLSEKRGLREIATWLRDPANNVEAAYNIWKNRKLDVPGSTGFEPWSAYSHYKDSWIWDRVCNVANEMGISCFQSPVNVTIMDNYGRVISEVENQIPGASFEYFNATDTKVFYLPLNLTYHFQINATDFGNITISQITPLESIYEIAFSRVKFNLTSETVAEFDLQSYNANYTLKVDEDGDGLNDYELTPEVETHTTEYDIGITEVVPSITVIGEGYNLPINTTVKNYGAHSETFNVTLYVNETFVERQSVTLTNGTSATKTFLWNTTGFTKDNYTISVIVNPVSGETYMEDNTLIGSWVMVTIPGDVDGDRDVDIFDIVAMVGSYSSEIGDPEYESNYDLDGDGDIDIFDIVAACNHYGESW